MEHRITARDGTASCAQSRLLDDEGHPTLIESYLGQVHPWLLSRLYAGRR